jgi:hypothetical protein
MGSAHCSTEPHGLKYHRGSPHRWMKRGAQTIDTLLLLIGTDEAVIREELRGLSQRLVELHRIVEVMITGINLCLRGENDRAIDARNRRLRNIDLIVLQLE